MSAAPAIDALRALLAAIPAKIGEGSCPGWFTVHGPKTLADGSITSPHCVYGPRFNELWAALKRAGALDDTDYMKWPGLADYETWRKRIADAPRGDLGKWLFAVYRRERFAEGLWAKELADGPLKEAISRLIVLRGKGE